MIAASRPDDENMRLQSVRSLNVLDTPPDLRIECITQFISKEIKTPISMVAIIDDERAWIKSILGLNLVEIPRDITVCAHAICKINSSIPTKRIFEVLDLGADNRFHDVLYVAHEPYVQSYLGFVLQSNSQNNVGTLCVLDTKPRDFTQEEKEAIITTGLMVENILLGRHFLSGIEKTQIKAIF